MEVLPGINEANISEIARKVALVAPHVSWVQIDFSDGTLMEHMTYMKIEAFAEIISTHPTLFFEAHLMVDNPNRYVSALAKAGFKRLVAHVECNDPRLFLEEAELESVEVGLAIDGPTEVELIEPFLDQIDSVLVMTYEIGPSGRTFQPETVDKIRYIHEGFPDLPIEVDGGISEVTAKVVVDAGATRLVSTSYVFSDPRRIDRAIKTLSDAG